jgi:Cft2 family RNA processing exonuclease
MNDTEIKKQTTIWRQVQQAKSRGDIKQARTALRYLVQGEFAPKVVWGDMAMGLGAFRLAARAYEQVGRAGQANERWLTCYLYAWLQAGADPTTIKRRYESISSENAPENLALEMDLYYRLGEVVRAAVAGKELFERLLENEKGQSAFVGNILDRVWVTLARLAEETGDVAAVRRFLHRLDGEPYVASALEPTVALLCLLLDQPLETRSDADEENITRLAERLSTLLSADFTQLYPPVPKQILAPLLFSLHKTLEALKGKEKKLALLEEAVIYRNTNMLARRLYVEELRHQGKSVKHVLAAEAPLWLDISPGRYAGPIARTLQRPPSSRESTFSFVALGGGSKVGGSAYLVDLNDIKLLLDAGLDIDTQSTSSYRQLKEHLRYSGVVEGLRELEAVIISHAHLDHVGLIPALYSDPDLPRDGRFSAIRFYASEATQHVARIMLEDAAKIAEKNEEDPLYTLQDVKASLDDLGPPKEELFNLFREDKWQIEMLDSGHILGARMILLEKEGFKVLYTGDFCTHSQLTLHAADSCEGLKPDVLIMESTYGYKTNGWTIPRGMQERAFWAHLDRVLRQKEGIVLLPAFAVGRSQELLGLVAEHARQNPGLSYGVYLDGLARRVTEKCYDRFDRQLTQRYREAREWIRHRLTVVQNNVDRDELIRERILGRPNVIIASSGMLVKESLSYKYAKYIAGDESNAIFYTGYLADDSEAVAFWKGEVGCLEETEIRCEQRRFHFSAHASKADLLQFVLDVRPRAVILVHGDAYKRGQSHDNLYAQLKHLESDTFQVFIGAEKRRINYDEGRFQRNDR